MTIADALAALRPGAAWTLRGDDLEWHDTVQSRPTDAEIAAALVVSIKGKLKDRVDTDAEAVRLKYITSGAGMAMTYQEKKDQAVAVIAMGEASANALSNHGAAEFPTLSASVPLEAASLYAAAQMVMQKYEQFAHLSRVIELTRLNGKKAISDASDAASARAAYEAIAWTV